MLRRDLLKRMTAVACGTLAIEAVAETPTFPYSKEDLIWGPDCGDSSRLLIHNRLPPNIITFRQNYGQTEVARIDSDGIMRFSIDATDENAKLFVDLIEQLINKRLTGVDICR